MGAADANIRGPIFPILLGLVTSMKDNSEAAALSDLPSLGGVRISER